MSSATKTIKVLSTNLIFCILIYLLFEIFTGNFISNQKLKCSYIKCNADYNHKITLYSKEKISVNYKKDKYGFRGRRKTISEIDIIAIGGSTTDERYLNEEDTWVEQLEKQFVQDQIPIDIVNAAIDGQSTVGHIWNFDNWFNKIENLQTKYFIFYIGLNEVKTTRRKDFKYDKKFTLINKIKYFIEFNGGITYKLYEFFYLKKNLIDEFNIGHNPTREAIYFKIKKKTKLDQKLISDIYSRLNELYILSKKFNSTPIFITQRSLKWKKVGNQIFSLSEVSNIYDIEKQKSDLIMKFCLDKRMKCINGFELFKLNEKDIYDLVHLNPKGSKKISAVLYENLKDLKF